VRQDALSRTKALYGEENLNKIQNAKVAIAGLGGVGGYALEALARTGIKDFTLIDFDTFDVTNLNRQLLCLSSNIGSLKTEEAKKRLLDIDPQIKSRIISEKLTEANIDEFLSEADIVVDAIDDINAKVLLIKEGLKKQIPIVCSMGAASRIDPTKIKVTDISKTFGCPLAKQVRTKLREEGIETGFNCVFSPEHYENSSKEILGSSVTVVGTFGLILAQEIINSILK